MRTVIERVEELAVDLFAGIPSQTSAMDRRSLLTVQRATARRHAAFSYVEIGSDLGGSIQPYLLEPLARRSAERARHSRDKTSIHDSPQRVTAVSPS